MAAPRGNDFYKYVKKPTGRPKKYTPATLWKKAQEYFSWNAKNPLWEMKAFANGKTKKLPKLRAMTEDAFCLFADIDDNTWIRYKNDDGYVEFWDVARRIAKIIYQQKFEGATADLMNANIIARHLGLKDRQETEVSNPDGTLTPKQPFTDDQVTDIITAIRGGSK